MTDPTPKHLPAQILVFLPEAAVSIVAKLDEERYVANQVSSQADLEGKLTDGGYDLMVTTRPNIDIVGRVGPPPSDEYQNFPQRGGSTRHVRGWILA